MACYFRTGLSYSASPLLIRFDYHRPIQGGGYRLLMSFMITVPTLAGVGAEGVRRVAKLSTSLMAWLVSLDLSALLMVM
ncbi:uncharacterized protein N7483_003165 [Penicillium malachiteum]|uniref:uncharacterized protein n=1 Tax=Penicillium malachiteum TaxID=1324776 RepID=UPI0025466F6C|nr:uncharacterized protein N7483_003165 [Penicillium malachiteum]KAJ5728657.1 hypothetical protein N7483_003165 [Penicillium malachiteum]